MTAIESPRATNRPVDGAPTERRRIPIPLLVLAVLAVGGAIFAWRRIVFGRTHITTDNAQIDSHITTVAARIPAFVARVLVDDNQHVRAGDTLVVLDDRDFRTKLTEAEADLASARAALGTNRRVGQARALQSVNEATAASAAATVQAAEASLRKAEADLERYRTLAKNRIISAQQLDQAQWAVDNARATLEASQKQAVAAGSQTAVAEAGVQVAAARLAAAEAAAETARLQLTYTVLIAPVSGTIAKRSAEVGALVQPGQNLMSLVPDEQLWITANLKETQLQKVRVGNEVEFTVDAYPGATFHGTVESVSPATGARFSLLPPDNASGNFTKVVQRVPVRIRVQPEPNGAHPLRPGLSAEVTIKVS